MNLQWKRLLLTAAIPVAMAVVAPAQADLWFTVDDFGALPPGQGTDPDTGVNSSYIAIDSTIDGNPEHVNAPPKYNGGTFQNNMMVPMGGTDNPNGWDRTISSNLISGDAVATEICYNCQAAHLTADAGVVASVGEYWFEWTGPSVNLIDPMGDSILSFDWGADLEGTTWFADINGVNTAVQAALPATPGPGSLTHKASINLTDAFGAALNDVTQISLHFNGVGALDANIDNVEVHAVPEPSILALLSVSLLGLGWVRRRRAG